MLDQTKKGTASLQNDAAVLQAKLNEIVDAIKKLRPKVTDEEAKVEAMRQWQRGIK